MKIKAMIIAVGGMLFAVLGLLVMICVFMADDDDSNDSINGYSNVGLSAEVLAYQPLVEHYASVYGISDYVSYLLAIMQVESGGTGTDPMQSSESMGLPVNTLTPEASIEQGCKHFANCLTMATNKGCDIDTVVQSYNYGTGFINCVADNGCKYTYNLAEGFAKDQSGGAKVTYSNPIAVAKNGGWRYKYGNMFYVLIVKQYLSTNGTFSGTFVYYNQADPQWGSLSYVRGDTIASSGCAATSLAMIWATYGKDTSITPATIFNIGNGNGALVNGWLSRDGCVAATNNNAIYGVTASHTNDWDMAMKALDAGGAVMVVGQGSAPFTNGGHWFVIIGYSGNTAYLADPGHRACTWSQIGGNSSGENLSYIKQQTQDMIIFMPR